MNKVQAAKGESLRRVQAYLDAQAKVVGAVNGTPARRQLDAAVRDLESARTRQGVLTRAMRGEAQRQRALERELRVTHVVPMAQFARAQLKRQPALKALAPKLHNVGGKRLAGLALAMVEVGARHAETYREAQFPADFLEAAAAAAAAVTASIERRQALRVERVQATKAIALALESGRSAVATLDAVVGRFFAVSDALKRGWLHAKRVAAVPGAARVPARSVVARAASRVAPGPRRETGARKQRRKRGRA